MAMNKCCIFSPIDPRIVLRVKEPKIPFLECINTILTECPPKTPFYVPAFNKDKGMTGAYGGLAYGPTSIAFLFFSIAEKNSEERFNGRTASQWCTLYLDCSQELIPPLIGWKESGCGIQNEFLAYHALKYCHKKDMGFLHKFLQAIEILEPDHSRIDSRAVDWLNGRAGLLYLLRFMRKKMPLITNGLIREPLLKTITHMRNCTPWQDEEGKIRLGAAHGRIGVLTQLLLTEPSLLEEFYTTIDILINIDQTPAGNWPVIVGEAEEHVTHFCDGAPGFVISFLALKDIVAGTCVEANVDKAISRGRDYIATQGMVTNVPMLCHGMTGSALALEQKERDHFLGHATPAMIRKSIEMNEFTVEEEIDDKYGMLYGEAGRAWVWWSLTWGNESAFPMYSDL